MVESLSRPKWPPARTLPSCHLSSSAGVNLATKGTKAYKPSREQEEDQDTLCHSVGHEGKALSDFKENTDKNNMILYGSYEHRHKNSDYRELITLGSLQPRDIFPTWFNHI